MAISEIGGVFSHPRKLEVKDGGGGSGNIV